MGAACWPGTNGDLIRPGAWRGSSLFEDGAVDYRYDARGQLLSADYADRPDESYAYDANGNRVADGTVVGQRNQVESDGTFRYEYDAQGNRIKRTDIATGAVTEYRWDLLNRLVEIIERTSDGGPVGATQFRTPTMHSGAVWVRRWPPRWGRPRRNATCTTASTLHCGLCKDAWPIGTCTVRPWIRFWLTSRSMPIPVAARCCGPSQITWERCVMSWITTQPIMSAQVANHIVYDAFGNVIDETAAAVDHIFGFTGREDDEQSDLNFYRARYYDPGMGQFLSEDPIGFSAGDANLYRYVQNSPTNKVDPTGCYDEDVHFYFNYYLARYLGLNQPSGWINSRGQPMSEALIIAYFATRVDYDAQTQPVGAGVPARSRYHFPDPDDELGVRERDRRVQGAIREVADAGDLEMFGILMHVFQDSFSHRGFGDVLGHCAGERRCAFTRRTISRSCPRATDGTGSLRRHGAPLDGTTGYCRRRYAGHECSPERPQLQQFLE